MQRPVVLFSAVMTLLFAVAAASAALAQGVVGAPQDWQLGFQAAASPVKEKMESFHDMMLVIITAITLFVLALLVYVMVRYRAKANPTPSKVSHNTLLEVVWTAVPVIILAVIVLPSRDLLYMQAKLENADLTLKVTGRQWYWDYEYPDQGVAFSSYMVPDNEIKPGQLRLLEVDNRIVLPVDTNVRIQVTAGDVLHSFAIPALGVKTDAVPGRLNETWTRITHEGVFYGQCSELCGVNHGYMPIAIEAVSKEKFAAWVQQKKVALAPSGTQVADTAAQ